MEMIKQLLKEVLSNPTLWAFLIGGLFVFAGWAVKRTATKKDDEVYAIVKGLMFHAFNIAEKMIPDNSDNKTAHKINRALLTFNKNVSETLNRNATKSEIDQAKALWSELAFELKTSLKKN